MRTIFPLISAIILSAVSTAQEVTVQMAAEEPPYYVGVGAIVQLTVNGLKADPEPKCTLDNDAPEIRAVLLGINPQIVQQMFQSGNQIRRVERVTHTIQFRVTANEPGEYQIGPFVIAQNGTEKRVDAIKMSFQEVPATDDMKIKLILPKTTVYPDQRVPVKIEWWFAGDTANVHSLDIHSPLLDDFRFFPDPPAKRGQSRLPIQTSQGAIALPATVREETSDEKRFTVVAAERTLIPAKPGEFKLAPITATVEVVTKWQRRRSRLDDFGFPSLFDDAFGDRRRPAKVELFRSSGQPLSLTVKPFPAENRPESFSGGVGKGFSLDVAADRTVVRVGDPIRLAINLRGDGNVEGATLPSLSADDGLDPEKFRLPDGDAAGVFDRGQGTKQFVVSVRVLDESIDEIPGIAYSWFDAEQERYQTTRSQPIALRVMPAKLVGVDAVVSSRPAEETQAREDAVSQSQSAGGTSYSLSGADLAIQPNPSKLLLGSRGLLASRSFQVTGYALGSIFIVIALVDRRRRQVDPAQRRRLVLVRTSRNRISASASLPAKQGATEIAGALQALTAEFADRDRSTIEAVIAQCEGIAYKPTANANDRVDSSLIQRALSAIDTFTAENQ